jgi:tyrosyl-tRNA synthetase
LAAGCDVVVLLADIHGFLDNLKAPVELVEQRVEYYRLTISALLQAVGVSTQLNNLTIVQGSSYQKTAEYVMDVYKLSSSISEHEAKRAGAEIVKQSDSAPLSGLLYPVLQVLDEQYLDVDAQFGGKLYYNPQLLGQYLIEIGLDQRKLFIAAKEWLPKLGYRQVCYHYRQI